MSENFAVFVDAGYLYIQGALASLGTRIGRHEVHLESRKFIDGLTHWIQDQYPHDVLLRTYWYDGAKKGIPTPEQLQVAALPYVKFRRGRINSEGQQKGVDTLIVRDLMVLSQERSIQRAVVLSGDEDLREGIEYAQDRGVRVSVVGIKANGSASQSQELVREADQVLFCPEALLSETLSRVRPIASATAPAVLTHATGPTGANFEADVVSVAPAAPTGESSPDPVLDAARECAGEWLAAANDDELAALLASKPSLPSTLDSGLLRFVVQRTHIYTLDEVQRRGVRRVFWEVIVASRPGESAGGARPG